MDKKYNLKEVLNFIRNYRQYERTREGCLFSKTKLEWNINALEHLIEEIPSEILEETQEYPEQYAKTLESLKKNLKKFK
jgi:hypothetical protein